ncbi:MAG: hypothetical protein E7539_04790 [Ruminococcaceae bacterium]|nr:hypothetical protein [Oscillospiraceae bacterium]
MFYSVTIALVELAITLAMFIVLVVFSGVLRRDAHTFFAGLSKKISPTEKEAIESFPLPVCILSCDSRIVWYNSLFLFDVLGGENLMGEDFSHKFKYADDNKRDLIYKNRKYTVYSEDFSIGKEKQAILYLVDNTTLKNDAEKFHLKKPSVIQIVVDNYEELLSSINGSERNFISSRIESILEKTFVTEANGILRKIEKDRFIAIVENKQLELLMRDKFNVLERIRKSTSSGHLYPTLSVGIGKDTDALKDSDLFARQALDMALGRGGDQVAVKSEHGYEFFGGLSKGVEKRAKVRSRMIASALSELVDESENVIIMGHKMADFDCLGAAVGLYKAISTASKPVHICIDREKNLSKDLIAQLCSSGYSASFVSPEQATDAVDKNTLLIVVDTHNPEITECPELLSLAGNVVVIDHHRKMVNHIDNAVIFYHEPTASSTCEMVTELIQYFKDGTLVTKTEAEALLSGIMLDTKNFIIKSGVRTFEAAAYLRRLGADLVKVNGWFASSIETYHQRAKLISAAEIIKGCAISYQDEFSNELLLAVPQTADELLHIRDVSASFVMYKRDGVVWVSARSFGELNVQLIMEKLGGGGHLTMAGAQIEAESCLLVKERLLEAIDSYFKENDIKAGGK